MRSRDAAGNAFKDGLRGSTSLVAHRVHVHSETRRDEPSQPAIGPFSKDIFKRCREGEHLYLANQIPPLLFFLFSSSFPRIFTSYERRGTTYHSQFE